MKAKTHHWIRAAVFVLFTLSAADVFGLGADYPNDQPVGGSSSWPSGMTALVSTTNRVHGFFLNAEDVFFFSGTATNFSEFLRGYSKLQGIEKHCLILHEGTGKATSPWNTNGPACDWKLYGCPKSWLEKSAGEDGYILEVHFWTGGRIALDQVRIPKNIEVRNEAAKQRASRARPQRRQAG